MTIIYPLFFLSVINDIISPVLSAQPIVPTYWGTTACQHIPEFALEDKNPASGKNYGTTYGLNTLLPQNPDLIIVGLYFGDSEKSWANAEKQQELGRQLKHDKYDVQNVIINFYAPLSCTLEGECVNFWWNNLNIFPGAENNCVGYVAGCAPQDRRILPENWQAKLANHTTLPIFQDTNVGWIWDEFGGLEGDIYIYDKNGQLYSYLCNEDNEGAKCETPMSGGGLIDKDSFKLAKSTAKKAYDKFSADRCKGYEYFDDYEKDGESKEYYYVDDSYYYNGKHGGGETTVENSMYEPISIASRHNKHFIIHKIPRYAYAIFIAIIASIITAILLLCRYQKNRQRSLQSGNIHRFHQIPGDDDDSVFESTAIGIEDENPFKSGSGSPQKARQDLYGSL